MPTYAMAGAASGCPFSTESQLERIANRLRNAWRSLIDTLNQPGNP